MAAIVDTNGVRLATLTGSEDAVLCTVDGVIHAIFVPVERDGAASAWFLLIGFGCCEQEGLIFDSLAQASRWIDDCLSARGAPAE